MTKKPQIIFSLKKDTVEELYYNGDVASRNQDVTEKYAIYSNKQHNPVRVNLTQIGIEYFTNKVEALERQKEQLYSRIALIDHDIDVIKNGHTTSNYQQKDEEEYPEEGIDFPTDPESIEEEEREAPNQDDVIETDNVLHLNQTGP